PVQAEDYGAAANVTAGMINEIATIVPGVDSVENRADWLISEGSDKEDDAALFERYVLAWQEKNGCTKHAYEAWARSVVGVASVKIVDQHPRGQGTVDVVITGAAGAPTQLLIDAVDAVVQAKAPINDDALVKGPELVAVDIVGELEIVSGDPPAILAEAEQRLRGLFYGGAAVKGIVPMRVGQDIPLDLLRWAVLGVTAGRVKRTTWTSPAEDVGVSDDGLTVLNSISLSYVWASEE
ncbi:MAG: baseplate assembly protein, partial [Deltaproteobacteria bacterium HGW-Deltaproteobacteria-21]